MLNTADIKQVKEALLPILEKMIFTQIKKKNTVEVEKWQRNDNRLIYYKIDEYETADENARKDLAHDNINYNNLITP